MKSSKPLTSQEQFWTGPEGDAYTFRNSGPEQQRWVASNVAFFNRALARVRGVRSVFEIGCNTGLNLMAIQKLFPQVTLEGMDINQTAIAAARQNVPRAAIYNISIQTIFPSSVWDLVFTKAFLIHMDPASLSMVYEKIYKLTRRFILLAEYYNPAPVEVPYRGQPGLLFKRDFAGEIMDQFPDLALLDYGFAYHRDPNWPQDDLTWWLLEKR